MHTLKIPYDSTEARSPSPSGRTPWSQPVPFQLNFSKHVSLWHSRMTFCSYFKHKSKPLEASTLPHTTDSPSTKDASFHVKSITKLQSASSIPCLHRCLVMVRKYMYVMQQTYDCTTHETTTTLPTMHLFYK